MVARMSSRRSGPRGIGARKHVEKTLVPKQIFLAGPGRRLGRLGGFGAYRFFTVKADKPNYILGTVERGNLVVQVGATGTLAAVTTVQVGTQVSGTISELHADFNSEVKQGQLLAKLDQAMLRAQVEQQEANVRTAEATLNDTSASIATNRANLEKAKVEVLDKQRKLKRSQELFDSELDPARRSRYGPGRC